ncbi:MAG TPA: prephenate dehydratase [Nitrospirae bacterium]|nr:P-protein [bacterium BMS3Abin06]HDH11819.1 prephenate dehydratase [Nitrospirota bacterium]HDZ02839.1 prephenate dehydratase [Nitrospirota bacterium]
MSELEKLRKKIDELDLKILELLNKRTEVVLDVGKTKQDKHLKVYSPERERAILKRLKEKNIGPFPTETLRLIYEEILSASLALQQPLKVSYLGPSATFTHLAAKRQFGSSADYIPESTIKEVFDSVSRDKARYGVVPIENSTEGVVNYTLDMFVDSDLKIAFEIMLPISHNLLSKTGKKADIKKIYSHSQARAQCRGWLESNFPGIPVIEELSTAAAAKRVSKDTSAAAVASELAASEYNLQFVEKGIEDNKTNFTRFLVIAKESLGKTGKDKTSIMFSVKDKPGALYLILRPFARHRINLTKIESRPSKRKAWEYFFFVDLEGHIDDKGVRKAINSVKKECLFFKVLGSYPSAE